MAKGIIQIEGKDYNYGEYLQKVFEYVQLKGFNKEAFQHIAALFWDLDARVKALEDATAAPTAPATEKPAKPAKAEKAAEPAAE